MRRLIVTADDFGLAIPVNEAVEQGHAGGILSTASLMVNAPATDDAIRRARSLPSLRVGLHLVLVNGKSVLDPKEMPALVDAQGNFSSDLFAAGMRYFFRPGVRAQLKKEIRAQFEAFAATGLALDHVNAQNHMHVHPTILSIILKVGKEFGLRATRIPYEPFFPSWRATRNGAAVRFANAVLLWPWLRLMKARVRRAGLVCNDYIFGMSDSGHLSAQRVRMLLANLPDGVSELYFHPATQLWPGAEPPGYDFTGEFAALIDPSVRAAVLENGIRPIDYSELAA